MQVIKQLMVTTESLGIYFPTMEVNGEQQLFGCSKYLILRSA